MSTLPDVGGTVLDLVRKDRPSAQIEAYLVHSTQQASEWSEGHPEEKTLSENTGLGLRVIDEGRLGFGYSNRLDSEALSGLARDVVAASQCSASDPWQSVVAPVPLPPAANLDLVDPHWSPDTFDARAVFLNDLESEAKKSDCRIQKLLQANYQEHHSQISIVNSHGLSLSHEKTQMNFTVACVAVEGTETQIGYAFQSVRHYEDLSPGEVLRKAVDQALSFLGGKRVPSGRYDLVLDPMVVAEMLELLAEALSADQVLKGKSFLGSKQDQTVAAPVLTLVDHGCLPRGVGSSPFDAEGLPTQKTVLLDRGRLKTFLYDSYTARKAGTVSTGNAGRASYKGVPEPEASNLYLEPGPWPPDRLMAQVRSGIYVRNVMGLHMVDTISGDFSLGIMGQRIENGQRTHAVRGVTIAGNFLELLNQVEAVGADRTFFGPIGASTLWIHDISVGGE